MLTVCAKTSPERGMKHIALFLVDRQFPGVTLGKRIEKLGVRASATGEIILDDVLVPDEHLLGGETGGVEKVGGILSEIRVMTGALSVGLGRAAYDAALRYSKERVDLRQADRRAPGGDLPARRHAHPAPRGEPPRATTPRGPSTRGGRSRGRRR